jgi:glycosyltransferase involved in cell wall biosynthesis
MLPKWWMFRLEIQFFDKLLNGVICISRLLYDHYLKIGFSEKRLLLIPNILDLSAFKNSQQTVRKINQENIVIGYCGAALLLNGVDDLIKAFSIINQKHPNIELLIVGDVTSENSQIPLLKQMAIDEGVVFKITFAGRVPGNDVPGYLSSCDILVLARKNTRYAQAGFPTKLGEYMAAKKPVVMTKVGDIPDYFSDRENIIMVAPDKPESLACGINYLIENAEKRSVIANNGFKWAMQNLNYETNCKKIYDFVQEISQHQ